MARRRDRRAVAVHRRRAGLRCLHVLRARYRRGPKPTPEIGKRIPLHATAAGKAILSALPDSRVDEIIEGHKLERFTDRTLTEPTELRREIAQIRERGYADNRGETTTTSLWAVGVPVRDADGTLLGAMSASAPSQRMKGERAQSMLPDLLLAVANELELNIRYV